MLVFFPSAMRSALCFFTLLVALASAQQFQDILTVDDFIIETPTIVILIPSNPSFPISESRTTSASDASIIGGERNLKLTVTSGDSNLVLTSGVAGGDFTCSTPNNAAGNSVIQWDGVDGSVDTLTGFSATNFRQNNGESFRTLIESDIQTTIVFRVFSGSAQCSRSLSIPGDDTTNEYILDFNDFDGSCDFGSVTAVQIDVEMFDNVDVLMELFVTYGPVPVTPSSSRTPTPTPTATPPPVGCVCQCPVFTCEVFRVDDQYYFYQTFFYGGFFTFNFFNNFFQFFDYFFDYFFFDNIYFFDIWYYIQNI